jgi:hypothetical protein
MEPGETSDEQARAIKEQLSRADAKIIGIVFNKVSEDSASSYYDYQYRSLYSPKYYGDYLSKVPSEPAIVPRSKLLLDFFERGKLPTRVAGDVESPVTSATTPLRNIFKRNRAPKENGKS